MNMKRYPAKQIEFLRTGFKAMRIPELTKAFNKRFGLGKTEGMIKSALKNHKITCGRKPGFSAGFSFLFSREQWQFIEDNYPRLSQKALAAEFNVKFETDQKTAQQIDSFVGNHRIKSGRTGCFEKGLLPWNAGTKGMGLTGPNSGTFRKGNVPPNRKPLGTERQEKRGDSKSCYIQVKIAERNPYTGSSTRYKCKHIVLWEGLHGPVPEGMCVVFRNGDQTKVADKNLMLVTRAELLRLNKHKYKEMPAGLKPSVLALAKLEVKTFQVSKSLTDQRAERG